jgi:hypothetical protein
MLHIAQVEQAQPQGDQLSNTDMAIFGYIDVN